MLGGKILHCVANAGLPTTLAMHGVRPSFFFSVSFGQLIVCGSRSKRSALAVPTGAPTAAAKALLRSSIGLTLASMRFFRAGLFGPGGT